MATLADVVAKYIAFRDEKAALKAEYDEKLGPVQAKLDEIEIQMLSALDQLGVESAKTPYGTAYVSKRTSASVADKDSFMTFVQEKQEWPLLEVRAAKLAVEQYVVDHQGELPPGISWSVERTVNFRRAS